MAVILRLNNGLIREYRTNYELYNGMAEGVYSTTASMCNISESIKCDHLYCAIHAARETAKTNKDMFKIFLIASLFWLIMPILSELSLIYALLGIYSLWQSKKYEKMTGELMEFKDNGTINGVVAHRWQLVER